MVNIILIILLSIIILCIFIIIKKNEENNKLKKVKNKELETIFKERWDKEEHELEDKVKRKELEIQAKQLSLRYNFELEESSLKNQLINLRQKLKEKEARYEEVNQDLDLYRNEKIKEINSSAAEYEKRKQLMIDKAVDDYRALQICRANTELVQFEDQKEDILNEINSIRQILEVERGKRAAINEEIRRQREIKEKEDFYKIQLNLNDLDDIKILKDVSVKLNHPEAINKAIWTGYYQKPLAELRKRAGIEGSGVYKITRLKTGEIYVGQALNISTRWAEHCKAALGVGTLVSSQLHRAMAADGCENFTFEVLEKVPKDKLKEKESYYINFYDSKNYGLNTLNGIKNK